MTIGQAANIIVAAWPRNVEAVLGGGQTAPILQPFDRLRVRVTRSDGQPAVGADITFTGPAAGASITPGTVRTDADGFAEFVPIANQFAGTFMITATGAGGFAPTTSFEVRSDAPGPAVGVSVVSGSNQAARTNATFGEPVRVKAIDRYGNGVGGQYIDLVSPGYGVSFLPSAVRTGVDGTGVAAVRANQWVMTETVIATLSGTGASTTFPMTVLECPPVGVDAIFGDGSRTLIDTPFPSGVVVSLKDDAGLPCAGLPVTFEVQPAGNGASASLFAPVVQTDRDGRATASVTANGIRGSYTVTATYGATTRTFTLHND